MTKVSTRRLIQHALIVLAGSAVSATAFAADTRLLWEDLPAQHGARSLNKNVGPQPARFRAVSLDFAGLKAEIAAIPISAGDTLDKVAGPNVRLSLPLPEGGFTEFILTDSGVLPPSLAQRYPEIRSLKGTDGKGRHLRLDVSPQGMKAIVYEKDGAWLVQPVETLSGKALIAPLNGAQYWSFRRSALPASVQPFHEKGLERLANQPEFVAKTRDRQAMAASGNIRRNYRIAVAATSAYTSKFGGTVPGGLAAVSFMINRVNEIFEKDIGVHLTLVVNNDQIIYTDPATDPYQQPGDILLQNVENVNKVIGAPNFDIGHVVDLGSGGVVGRIGSTCMDNPGLDNKAAGTTGRNNPVGDAFYVDYVAHELGHQFGAWHSFNRCNGRRSTLERSALEPGSGSTIMGYAGICGVKENLQSNSDPYFHAVNQDQIQAWIASKGGACAVKSINANDAPWIDPQTMPGGGFKTLTIPAGTPFVLQGKATGNPDATLTYAWEQLDAGPVQGEVLKDDGKGPLFRSYLPNTSGERVFPRLAAVLGDEPLGNGEAYPAMDRKLTFRLTVRDNFDTQATTATADTVLAVRNTGSAFAVTLPKKFDVLTGGSVQTVGWDVAKTDEAPISCKQVRIDLSLNGGYTYLPDPLLAAAPNIGSASVMLPSVPDGTSRARIKVSCANHVFFAVSPGNFIIR
ncbi:reprolysin-like metallopeptidase [Chitinivorax sp. B]|uniref:reprolysin-like metallopeptidase n=1 Tax=Chitinivorax sp. B TaxID=2502235 RepID=UPI0010F76996|nr:zinc-dependent metalloprotease family protein [Chitinivorax sp. B]